VPKTVKLKMNASSGKVDLQCSEDFFEDAMSQCIDVISTYQKTRFDERAVKKSVTTKAPSKKFNEKDETEEDTSSANAPKKTRSKSGKSANYNQIDLKLTDEQARDLRSFFEGKSPKNQNDIVCVVAFKLKEFLNKDDFSKDEIFSGIRLIPGVKTPKNLRAVFQNTMDQGNCSVEDGKFIANFATDDYVNLKLPESRES